MTTLVSAACPQPASWEPFLVFDHPYKTSNQWGTRCQPGVQYPTGTKPWAEPVHWYIYASPGLNRLTHPCQDQVVHNISINIKHWMKNDFAMRCIYLYVSINEYILHAEYKWWELKLYFNYLIYIWQNLKLFHLPVRWKSVCISKARPSCWMTVGF